MNPRERLLEVALTVFVARGFDAVGVQEIVESAGVTKPTLYHHYRSKRGLLDAVAADVARALDDIVAPALDYSHRMPENLERLIAALLRFAAERPRETRLLVASQNAPAGSETRLALAPVRQRLNAGVEAFFADAAGDHGNMAGRAREFTVALLGVVFAYAMLVLDDESPDSSVDPHRIMRQFSYGIYS